MSIKKRLYSLFTFNINSLLEQIEDHESLAKGAVKDCARGVAELESHRERIRNHLTAIRNERARKEDELKELIKAAQAAPREEALTLSKRGVLLQNHIRLLQERENTMSANATELEAKVLSAEHQLHALAHRTHSLQARTAQLQVAKAGETYLTSGDTFERWESRVRAEELFATAYTGISSEGGPSNEEAEAFLSSIEKKM